MKRLLAAWSRRSGASTNQRPPVQHGDNVVAWPWPVVNPSLPLHLRGELTPRVKVETWNRMMEPLRGEPDRWCAAINEQYVRARTQGDRDLTSLSLAEWEWYLYCYDPRAY